MMCTVFSSPNIVQHYGKFDLHAITMLEKLSGMGSFGIIMDHLVCHQKSFYLLL